MRLPGIDEKVAFLSRPEAYPAQVQRVEIIQTHMSWVFLTETDAWKLKKPVRTEYLDFSTSDARRIDCEAEVRLNRRLAANVYRGVVALTVNKKGHLQLAGDGKPVDWLVRMRLLPVDRMLDYVIKHGTVSREEMSKVASLLAAFYATALPVSITGEQYRHRLATDLQASRAELVSEQYGLSKTFVDSAIHSHLEFLHRNASLFDQRVLAGRIVEGHGDLRPEHVCLEAEPVVIDCLEFNQDLRTLDAVSDLAFLAMECERLGASQIGQVILDRYCEVTGDRPENELIEFYKCHHACVRAKVAIWHLRDDSVQDPSTWVEKAAQYLETAGARGRGALGGC